MKRKLNIRKLILSLSTIGMLALTTTASTYAWFKINAKASVENFNFEVIGGKGFMVSVDGETYYNYLNTEQLEKAMIVSMSDRYVLGCEKDEETGKITESDVLYRILYDHGVKVREKVENPEELVENMMKNLQLAPVTTKDGNSFTNLIGVGQNASSGSFAEFGVYFKSTSDKETDNLKYDVYLDGYGGLDNEGNKILPTKFTSEITNVQLMTDMNAVVIDDNGNKSLPYTPGQTHSYTYHAGDTIKVLSTNAARISTIVGIREDIPEEYKITEDVKYAADKFYYRKEGDEFIEMMGITIGDDIPENTVYEFIQAETRYNPDTSTSLIYEINDTENGKYDLGSYVSTYDHTYNDGNYDMNTYYNYSYECNAMYTYYNNLRQSAQLKKDNMPYETLPNTIKSLPTKSSDNITSNDYDTIVQVKSGEAEKLVTFRVWLEGWDADCFDGLSKKIDVRLALGSKKVD